MTTIVALAGIAALPSTASANRWDYIGHFEGQPESVVRLKVAHGNKPGAAKRMIVSPLNYERVCDDGTTRMQDGIEFAARFTGPRAFHRRLNDFYPGPHAGDVRVAAVTGRIDFPTTVL